MIKRVFLGLAAGLVVSLAGAGAATALELPFAFADDPRSDLSFPHVSGEVTGDFGGQVVGDALIPSYVNLTGLPRGLHLEDGKYQMTPLNPGSGFQSRDGRVIAGGGSWTLTDGGGMFAGILDINFYGTNRLLALTSLSVIGNRDGLAGVTFGARAPAPAPVPPPDTTPPLLVLPADVTLEATGPAGAVATWTGPTATDNSGAAPSVFCSLDSGSMFPLGKTIVDCMAWDGAYNFTFGSFNVTVVDTTPPVFLHPEDTYAKLLAGDGMQDVQLNAECYDAVDPLPTCQVVSVEVSNRLQALGIVPKDDPAAALWEQTGALGLRLLGTQGYEYKVTVSVRDASGNSTTRFEGTSVPITKVFVIQFMKGRLRPRSTTDAIGVRG